MSASPISLMQVQGLLHQSKRRFGATAQSGVTESNGVSRFEALLRGPQQLADTMASPSRLQHLALPNQLSQLGVLDVEQPGRVAMNLNNVSDLATLADVGSVEPSDFSKALQFLTDAAEKNQLNTVEASGATVHSQAVMGMTSVMLDGDVTGVRDAHVQEPVAGDKTAGVEGLTGRQELGLLASMFKSGSEEGIGAIGYDAVGGTSYGKYQYPSTRGTMDEFLTYLDSHASDISLHLRAAGEMNTGSIHGEMPTSWKEVAAIDPVRFEKMQDAFMQTRYFAPVANVVQDKMNVGDLSNVMKEVLLSTSLKHGPSGAVRIFAKAFGRTGEFSNETQEDFIKNVYELRGKEFASSEPEVQNLVQNRLRTELNAALSMIA